MSLPNTADFCSNIVLASICGLLLLLTACAFALVAKPVNPIVMTENNKIGKTIFIIYPFY
jgi:hypothetical protein